MVGKSARNANTCFSLATATASKPVASVTDQPRRRNEFWAIRSMACWIILRCSIQVVSIDQALQLHLFRLITLRLRGLLKGHVRGRSVDVLAVKKLRDSEDLEAGVLLVPPLRVVEARARRLGPHRLR